MFNQEILVSSDHTVPFALIELALAMRTFLEIASGGSLTVTTMSPGDLSWMRVSTYWNPISVVSEEEEHQVGRHCKIFL